MVGTRVLQAASEPIERPGHHDIKLAPRRSSAQRIKGRALVAALGAADAVVLVDLDDLAAYAAGDLAELALLIGGRLIGGRDPQLTSRRLQVSNYRRRAPIGPSLRDASVVLPTG